jgi:hypothetical protein
MRNQHKMILIRKYERRHHLGQLGVRGQMIFK